MRGNAAFELKLFVPLEGEEREESRLGGGGLNLQKHNGNNKPASHIQLCGILLIILQISPRDVLPWPPLSRLAESKEGGTEEESEEQHEYSLEAFLSKKYFSIAVNCICGNQRNEWASCFSAFLNYAVLVI